MKQLRLLAVVGFNLLLLAVLLELTGLIDYYAKTREVYYFSRSRAELLPELHRLERRVEFHRLHPYFGYVSSPSSLSAEERRLRGIDLNNYGFDSPYNYPYRPRSECELVVGLFGGSVAAWLERFERERGILAERLAAATGRGCSEVTVLCFAQGGFKQPQQLLIYDYFRALGQRLDVVVNLDGFNEIALSAGNARLGVAVDMPSMGHLQSLRELVGEAFTIDVESGFLEAMVVLRETYREYLAMHRRTAAGEARELKLAGGFFIDRKLTKLYRKRFGAELHAFQELRESTGDSWLYLNDFRATGEAPRADAGLDAAVELWVSSSSMLRAALARDGGHYFHFVQPNQYHPTARVFSERERAMAIDERSSYAEPIGRGYPSLRRRAAEMAADGFPIRDLAELFDDLEAEAYSDNCCHYTDAGQELLARVIADVVGEALASAPASRAGSGGAASPARRASPSG